MSKNKELKENELLVLCAILHLGDDAYGVTIKKRIEESAGRTISTASIYLSLNRLENDGLVKSTTGGATSERGGRRKTYFKLTPTGQRVVKNSINSWLEMVLPIARKWELL